jgi:WD40 repeat protein
LRALRTAVGRELFTLRRGPDLLWQQLYNRIAFDPRASSLLEEWDEPRDVPWLRLAVPIVEAAELERIVPITGDVFGCAVDPRRGFVITVADVVGGQVWDPETGTREGVLHTPEGRPTDDQNIAIGGEGSLAMTSTPPRGGPDDLLIHVWDLPSGSLRHRFEAPYEAGSITGCAISADGRFVAGSGERGGVLLWDATTARMLGAFEEHDGVVGGVSPMPDGRMVSAGRDGFLRVWDPASRRETLRIHAHSRGVTGFAASPDGTFLISAGTDDGEAAGPVKIWDATTGELRSSLMGLDGPARLCRVSPDGSLATAASTSVIDRGVKVWDVTSGRLRTDLIGHSGPVTGLVFTPDGSRIVTTGDLTIRIWNTPGPAQPEASGSGVIDLPKHRGHPVGVTACRFVAGGTAAVSAGGEGSLQIWELPGLASRSTTEGERGRGLRDVQPDGRHALTGRYGAGTRIYDLEARALAADLPGVTRAAFAGDGSFLVGVGPRGGVGVWPGVPTPGVPPPWVQTLLIETPSPVTTLVASPGGRFAATRGGGKIRKGRHGEFVDHAPEEGHPDAATTRVWDLTTGEQTGVLGGAGQPRCFLPDGRLVTDDGGEVAVWDEDARVCRFRAGEASPVVVVPSPDGALLVTVSDGDVIRVWGTTAGDLLGERHAGRARSIDNHRRARPVVTPDGALLAWTDQAWTLHVARLPQLDEILEAPLPGDTGGVDLHPVQPQVLWGDGSGTVYLAELAGVDYGPIVTVPHGDPGGLEVRCPGCRHTLAVPPPGEAACPDCDLALRITEFSVDPIDAHRVAALGLG